MWCWLEASVQSPTKENVKDSGSGSGVGSGVGVGVGDTGGVIVGAGVLACTPMEIDCVSEEASCIMPFFGTGVCCTACVLSAAGAAASFFSEHPAKAHSSAIAMPHKSIFFKGISPVYIFNRLDYNTKKCSAALIKECLQNLFECLSKLVRAGGALVAAGVAP